ncbi:MAG: hypothetical protein HON90_00265 [Halobacteriovoraceae bacterium]|nr:hypothetical protein [Halobacteriovoraceae bacterium]
MKMILVIFILGFAACSSEVQVEKFNEQNQTPEIIISDLPPVDNDNNNDVIALGLSISNIDIDSFTANITISNDENDNSAAQLFYCNETDSAGCDPLLFTPTSLIKTDNSFKLILSSLASPNDAGDILNIVVVVSDIDGVTNATLTTQLTLQALYKIHRSLAVGATTTLENGSGNDLTILAGVASFASDINIYTGIGDAIQYDRSGDTNIDSIMFITERVDNQTFKVQNADGTVPTDMAGADQDWDVFRAYTSLADAQSGNENAGININVKNFDSHTDGKDLVSGNLQWHIAAYMGSAPDTTSVVLDNWITSKTNFLRVYSPHLLSEVEISQTHTGVWHDEKYSLSNLSTSYALSIESPHVKIQNLQIISLRDPSLGNMSALRIQNHDVAEIEVSHCYIRDSLISGGNTSDSAIKVALPDPGLKIRIHNNIIHGGHTGVYAFQNTDIEVYNNTIVGATSTGINFGSSVTGVLKNNIVYGSGSQDYDSGTKSFSSSNNISSDASSYDISYRNITPSFIDINENDYRLKPEDAFAKNQGVDLSTSFATDIMGHTRGTDGSWDIGAHEAATKIYRSIGTQLTVLENGVGNDLTISSGVASFSIALPNNVGIGDALEYDSDNDNVIDSVMFFSQRNSATSFNVQKSDGSLPDDLAIADNDWNLFRAYNSFVNLQDEDEANNLDGAVENFDTTATKDLVANNTEIYLAAYSDGALSTWQPEDWVTNETNSITLLAPKESNHVGTSQRHNGLWDTNKTYLEDSTSASVINLYGVHNSISQTKLIKHLNIIGLQIHNTSASGGASGDGIKLDFTDWGQFYLRDNLIKRTVSQAGEGLYLRGENNNYTLINNLVYGFYRGIRLWSNGEYLSRSIVYNNTVANSSDIGIAYSAYNLNDYAYIKNNLIIGSSTQDYDSVGTFENQDFLNNLSSDNTAYGTSTRTNATVGFYSLAGADFRLLTLDNEAKGRGVDLSTDAQFAFNIDIAENTRSSWDIGAFSYIDYSAVLANYNESGAGTTNDPYIIANKAQLLQIDDLCGGGFGTTCADHFRIIEDINLAGETWSIIGDTVDPFTASFDCANNTISNLNLNLPTTDHVGFFGEIDSTGIVSNCTFLDATITGQNYVGTLAGGSLGSISNITISNTSVSGNGNYTGGLAGFAANSLLNSSVSGTVNSSGSSTGGIVGRTSGGTISNLSSSATVIANYMTGGVIGNTDNSNLSNLTNTGNITATTSVGGVLGSANGNGTSVMSGLYSEGSITATGDSIGGLIGVSWHPITNSFSAATVRGVNNVGGLVGLFSDDAADPETITNSYAIGDVYGSGSDVGGLVGQADSMVSISTSWASGDVRGNNNVGGLVGYSFADISDSFSHSSAHTPTGGLGNVGGLIGYSDGATLIRNYATGNVTNASGYGTSRAGGLVGRCENTSVTDSYATGVVFANRDSAGGLIGTAAGASSVLNSYASGSVFGESMVGGLIGNTANTTSVIRSYAIGSVAGNDDVGGLIGYLNSTNVSKSYALGDVTGSDSVGALIGEHNSGTLSESFAAGTPIGTTNVNAAIGVETGGTINDIYYNSSYNTETAGSATGLTDSVLKGSLPTNFVGADWFQMTNRTYPLLKVFAETICFENPGWTAFNASGAGTVSDPYLICNYNQLNDIDTNEPGSLVFHYKLAADISLHAGKLTHASLGSNGVPFTGSFDGNQHLIRGGVTMVYEHEGIIKNLFLENFSKSTTSSNKGLLANYSDNGVTLNNHVFGDLTSTTGTTSLLIGRQYGRDIVVNNTAYGSINSFSSGGGIVGYASSNSFIYKSKVFANQFTFSYGSGGVVGRNSHHTIKNKAFGTLSGTQDIGGIVGLHGNGDFSLTNQNITSLDLNVTGDRIGGLIGYGTNTSFTPYIMNNMAINFNIDGDSTASTVGGLYGFKAVASYNLTNNTFSNIAAETGGIAGYSSASGFGNFWNENNGITDWEDAGGEIAGQYEGLDFSNDDHKVLATFTAASWDMVDVWAMSDGIRGPHLRWDLHPVCQTGGNIIATEFDDIGTGTANDPYLICFKEQLLDIGGDNINGCNSTVGAPGPCSVHFMLMNDINLKSETFIPIGSGGIAFTGSFNGNNHIISQMTISQAQDQVAFISYLGTGGKLQNIKFYMADVTGQNNTAIAVGENRGHIDNVEARGIASGLLYTGGLVGLSTNVTTRITNSIADVAVSSTTERIGGFIGGAGSGIIDNCHSYGDVTSTVVGTARLGGFVGQASGTGSITNSSAVGDVTTVSGSSVGGFIGYAHGGFIITHSSAQGDVTGDRHVGGFVGNLDLADIENSFAKGDSTAASDRAGGFVATATNAASNINNCYAEGVPTAPSLSGGFIGDDTAGGFSRNYWNSDKSTVSGGSSITEYDPLTSAQMEVLGNFNVSWDFANNWRIIAGEGPDLIPTP